jgi:hypothetical protein
MVKEEFNDGKSDSSTYTNFKTLMIINWVFFILAVILELIIIICIYKHIKFNSIIQIFVGVLIGIFYILSLALSIVGLSNIPEDEGYKYENALEQQKKYKPHFISLLILTIIFIFVSLVIFK